MRQKKVATFFFTMIFVMLLLAPISTRTVSTLDDTANSLKVSVSAHPTRIQEGDNTTITIKIRQATFDKAYTFGINVTNPAGTSSAINATITTNATGFGEKTIEYWKEFTEGANTNYVGRYVVTVKNITTNETLATTSFTVGLTYQLQHRRNQTVLIKGSGYEANETVTINIELYGMSVSGYPKNLTASDKGIISDAWQIPENAIPEVYTVAMTNATTPGTVKTPQDNQDFYVEVWTCQIRALNLADKPVANSTIEANNKTMVSVSFLRLSQPTNETGWASFMLATGNYTFKAFWKQIEVGNFPTNITDAFSVENDTVLRQEPWVQLSNSKITVIDEATKTPLPFTQLKFEYNYTIEPNKTITEASSFETNITGTVLVHNLLINANYTVEAKRHGLSLPSLHGKILPQAWNNITIEFPTYTVFIHVVDSKNSFAEGVTVEAYEWSKGMAQPDQSKTTDLDGNVTLSLTFGKYTVQVHKDNILLNETTIDLIQDHFSFTFHLDTYNIDFTVAVVDYFGQPIPNAVVKVERKTNAEYVENTTGTDGRATFSGVIGGDSRILTYIGGQLSGTKDLYLTDSKQVTFILSRYVVIFGYIMETSQFGTAIAVAILIVVFIAALTYKRLLKIFMKGKQAPSVKKSL